MSIDDMDNYFSAENARQRMIDKLKKKGMSGEKITEMVEECDKMHKYDGTPYPEIE